MFGIDLAVLLGLGGFVTTLVVGAPLMRLLEEPGEWLAQARKKPQPERERPTVKAGFEPLDLGEDPMSWPSERPWREGIASPPWPSQTWDDEHFGRHWREGPGESTPGTADTPVTAPRRSRTNSPPRGVRRAPTSRRPKPSVQPPAAERAPSRAPVPSPRTEEAPTETGLTTTAPTREELERLITEIGLAGTVQNIMRRTGWDFRKAAHYLARVRQGQ